MTVCGWAWIVLGRRLFVWNFMEDASSVAGKAKASKCYTLQLPPSDIAHKAELVCVMKSENNQNVPSALAVTPEGLIRYWSNISQENNMIDSAIPLDLQGQECCTLIDIAPFGYILGTTTSSLVHIYLDSAFQDPVVRRILRTPQSLLSGISRRVSSIIFGALPTAHSTEGRQLKRVIRSYSTQSRSNSYVYEPLQIYALSDCSIQNWHIDYDTEKVTLVNFDEFN